MEMIVDNFAGGGGVMGRKLKDISRQHLHLYTAELDFKYNTRKSSDGERTAEGIRRIEGKRLMYKPKVSG